MNPQVLFRVAVVRQIPLPVDGADHPADQIDGFIRVVSSVSEKFMNG